MKIKKAIIYGILIWILTYILSVIFNPIFTYNLSDVNIVVPIIIIIVTGFFGILYIRNIDQNEVIEGLLVGIVFVIIDIICDYIFLMIAQRNPLIVGDFPTHIIAMFVITLSITTFLGYLAQMKIDLK